MIIGWISSMILLATIVQQIYTQWKKGSSEGVSWFLFIGQAFASVGFVIYSWMQKDMVFVFTNGALLLSHFCGLWITYRQKT
jgi:uncharacterized protein with PQ loop repeat